MKIKISSLTLQSKKERGKIPIQGYVQIKVVGGKVKLKKGVKESFLKLKMRTMAVL